MKRMSPSCSDISVEARSPGIAIAGPEVTLIWTPISFATTFANVVLPSPGGPCSSMWSSGSPRALAASIAILRFALTFSWPMYSASQRGRRLRSRLWSSGCPAGPTRRSPTFTTVGRPNVCSRVRLYHVLRARLATGLYLLAPRVVAATAHQRVGGDLAGLDAGLVEGVDPEQLADRGGLHLEREHELADRERVHLRQRERHARPPRLGQRDRGTLAFDLHQLVQRVAAQVVHLRRVGPPGRYLHLVLEPLDRDEVDDLVGAALDVELHLRVLVGHAQRLDRRRADVDVV